MWDLPGPGLEPVPPALASRFLTTVPPGKPKIDFKIKTVTREKEGHYIMIKASIQEEDTTIINIYAPNIGAPQYIRQMLRAIKEEIDSNTIIVGTSIPHLHQWTDHPDRKLIRKHQL